MFPVFNRTFSYVCMYVCKYQYVQYDSIYILLNVYNIYNIASQVCLFLLELSVASQFPHCGINESPILYGNIASN